MKGSSASSEVNTAATPLLTGKRIFIKNGPADVSGTGSILSNKTQLVLKTASKVTMEQLETKINDTKEELNKYVQDLSEDLIKIRDYCYNNTSGIEDRL